MKIFRAVVIVLAFIAGCSVAVAGSLQSRTPAGQTEGFVLAQAAAEASEAVPAAPLDEPLSQKGGSAQAQSCPEPDPGEAFCGFFNGYCRYCDVDYPHYCPSTNKCYKYFTGAQEACGNNYVICGGPVR